MCLFFVPVEKKLLSFGTRGSGQGQFISPCGLAVDVGGNILVADGSNHRIQKFTAEGQFLTSVAEGNGRLQFIEPHGLTFNATNDKVYVAEFQVQSQSTHFEL